MTKTQLIQEFCQGFESVTTILAEMQKEKIYQLKWIKMIGQINKIKKTDYTS